jgi:hypothetical protein
MNRETAALGVPVYLTFGERLGELDAELIRESATQAAEPIARARTRRVAGRVSTRARRDRKVIFDRCWPRPTRSSPHLDSANTTMWAPAHGGNLSLKSKGRFRCTRPVHAAYGS